MVDVKMQLGTTDGGTIQAFQKIIDARIKYLNQTARQSVLATCIDILKSVKPITKVAKKSSVKVEVRRESNLYPSFTRHGKPEFCLRVTGTKERYTPTNEVVRKLGKITKNSKVFRYTNTSPNLNIKTRNYLIICETLSQATQIAKRIALSPIKKYAGLAKRAVSLLMKKTATWLNSNDTENNQTIQKIANKITAFQEEVKESDKGGTYIATLSDNLKYAVKAVIGTQSGVNLAMKKALNKISGNISKKLGNNNADFWGRKLIETPFPELKTRK